MKEMEEKDLERIKNYVKVDHDFDDDLLQEQYELAEQEIIDSVDRKADIAEMREIKQFNYAALILTKHWYDNRGVVSSQNMSKISHSYATLVQKIRGLWYVDH